MSTTVPRPRAPDALLTDIANYVGTKEVGGPKVYRLARYCLMDALGCAFAAFGTPDCVKFLGPFILTWGKVDKCSGHHSCLRKEGLCGAFRTLGWQSE